MRCGIGRAGDCGKRGSRLLERWRCRSWRRFSLLSRERTHGLVKGGFGVGVAMSRRRHCFGINVGSVDEREREGGGGYNCYVRFQRLGGN